MSVEGHTLESFYTHSLLVFVALVFENQLPTICFCIIVDTVDSLSRSCTSNLMVTILCIFGQFETKRFVLCERIYSIVAGKHCSFNSPWVVLAYFHFRIPFHVYCQANLLSAKLHPRMYW